MSQKTKTLSEILQVPEALELEQLIEGRGRSAILDQLHDPARVQRFLTTSLWGSYVFARFLVPQYASAVFSALSAFPPVSDELGYLLARIMDAIRGELFNNNIYDRPGDCHSHYHDLLEAYEAAGGDMVVVRLFTESASNRPGNFLRFRHAMHECWNEGARYFAYEAVNCTRTPLALFIAMATNELLAPMIYGRALASLSPDPRFDKLRTFLSRHVELDGDDHGPAMLEWLDLYIKKSGMLPEEVSDATKQVLALYGRRTIRSSTELPHPSGTGVVDVG